MSSKWLTVYGLIAGALGMLVQRFAGLEMPVVPPGLVLLLVAAVLVTFVRWRWIPVVGALIGLAEILGGYVLSGFARLLDPDPFGIFAGGWIRFVGVVVALVFGIVATVMNYRAKAVRTEA